MKRLWALSGTDNYESVPISELLTPVENKLNMVKGV